MKDTVSRALKGPMTKSYRQILIDTSAQNFKITHRKQNVSEAWT